jgi:protein-disulfide isomerase
LRRLAERTIEAASAADRASARPAVQPVIMSVVMASPNDPARSQRRAAASSAREEQERAAARRVTQRKRIGVLAGVVALAAVLAVVLLLTSSPDEAKTPTAAPGEAVPGMKATAALLDGIPQRGRVLGKSDAPVTLVEFADVQCPFCRQYTEQALPTVIQNYVRPGKVRLEFRPRTFIGPDSVTAARSVVAAGQQGKLWNVLGLLYANQGKEGSGWVTQSLLNQATKAAGADPAATAKAAKTSAAVTQELKVADLLATRNGLDSTPAFLIGKTGGKLTPLAVQALTAAFFSSALDAAAKG